MEGFYRTHMFEECHKCGQGGLECTAGYASLKSGNWWEWRNKTFRRRYNDFIENLLTSSPVLDAFHVQYPYHIPTPYKCLREESCKGGLDSPCEAGYEGPLCAVCSVGYYKQMQICTQCPSKNWVVGQLLITATVLSIMIVFFIWTGKRKAKKTKEHHLIDMMFSKLKIVIGFYQLTHGLLEAFSYIQWPDSLQVIGKYSELLQLNVLQIAPIQCLFPGIQVDAFGNLFAMMTINAAVIGFSCLAFGVYKVTTLRRGSLELEEKQRRVSQVKGLVYRNLFFFLYVTFLSTCSKTASVLPPSCVKLCRDEKEELCLKYLRADYSVECQGKKYSQLLIAAYISTAYIIVLPVASFVAIWRQQKVLRPTIDTETPHDLNTPGKEMISGLCFLFENYKSRSWYWELVEISRKVILTSGLILVGQESRSYVGLTWAIAGLFGVFFAWMKPMNVGFENRLMTTSLAVTVVNLGVGAASRIPAENLPTSANPYMDAVLFKILVLGANTLVIGLLVGKLSFTQSTLFGLGGV